MKNRKDRLHDQSIKQQKATDVFKLFLSVVVAVLGLNIHASPSDTSSFTVPTVDGQQEINTATGELKNFVRNINIFNTIFPQEKVYLHLDNTGYFVGESIYFKAYVTRTDKGTPSDISRVLYVELLNTGGEVIEKRTLKIENGQAHGDIKLETEKVRLPGFYEIRAYTRYMTNWDYRGVFSRTVPVFGMPEREGDYSGRKLFRPTYTYRLPDYREKEQPDNEGLNVTFYPEGGRLVKGIESRVAFRVTNEKGMPVDTVAYITGTDGNIVGTVGTVRDGCGWFAITPDSVPYAFAFSTQKKAERFRLPQALPEGWAMNVDMLYRTDSIRIGVRTSRPGLAGDSLGLSLMNNGRVVRFHALPAEENDMEMIWPLQWLPGGVSQLTLFDRGGRIMAERMVFKHPGNNAGEKINIKPETEQLNLCGKVRFAVKTEPNTTFSVSAIDVNTQAGSFKGNILTYMLLASELKGYVHKPEFYFEADDRQHRAAADLLMMVQGWRRYDWETMSGNKPFLVRQPVEDGLYLTGKLNRVWKWNKTQDVEVAAYLYNDKGQSFSGKTMTDSVGRYSFSLPEIEGRWDMVLKTRKDGELKSFYVAINRHFSPKKRQLNPYETDDTVYARLKQNVALRFNERPADTLIRKYSALDKLLPEVEVKEKRIYENARAAWENEKNGSYRSNIYYDCVQASEDILDWGVEIPDYRTWLKIRNPFFGNNKLYKQNYGELLGGENLEDSANNNGDRRAYEYDDIYPIIWEYKSRPILEVLNNFVPNSSLRPTNQEMPVFLDEIKSIYICEDLERYRGYQVSKSFLSNPPVMLFIYTHQTPPLRDKGVRRTYFQGYNIPNTFEMNDYSIMPPMEDFRRTLYWNPEVKTDEKGEAFIEFYNNSSCREIYLSAEGMTKEGKYIFY